MAQFKDAFISYGRAESKAFAGKLHQYLTQAGLDIWIDQNDIPLGVDFQNEINEGIELAHNFIFIIAPHSVTSPYCLKEIEWALKWNKRIIPILHVEPDKETLAQLHPHISKINWIYFREQFDPDRSQEEWAKIDDFDLALPSLVQVLNSHKDYIYLHTKLLNQAIEWKGKYQSTALLLVGREREQAEDWLLRSEFGVEQSPCEPSFLHCDYICESKKNAQNMMTDVFISYATEDKDLREQVSHSLARYGITTWLHTKDISSGVDFGAAIDNGIEQADNFLFFISPDSIKSKYCLIELEHALKHNKRVIPVLIRETSLEKIPESIQKMQFIDFTDNTKSLDYHKDIDDIISEIRKDRDYYFQHKVFLTQAIKWKRQNQNASVLLRGYNLQNARIWFKQGMQRAIHQPTTLHDEFISESTAKSGQLNTEVFVSYSRKDSDFSRKLNDALQVYGKTTWFDQESIAEGTDFQREIYKGIEGADNFLFIISPDAIKSEFCVDEVEYAARLNKRFIPLLYRPTSEEIPPQLAAVQWVNFERGAVDFETAFSQLVRTLDTDREYVHQHTKWSQRAQEWDDKERSNDLFLRGSEFALAEAWLINAEEEKKQPAPTELQKIYIDQSRQAILAAEQAEKERQTKILRLEQERAKEAEARLGEQKRSMKRQRILLVAVSIALFVAIGVGYYALQQKALAEEQTKIALDQKRIAELKTQEAEEQRQIALQQKTIAEEKTQEAEEQREIAVVQQDIAVEQKSIAEKKTIEAEVQRKEAFDQRNLAIQNQVKILLDEVKRLEQKGDQLSALLAGAQAAQQMQQASEVPAELRAETTSTLHQLLAKVRERNRLESTGKGVLSVNFSGDGSKIAATREGNSVEIWSVEGELLKSWKGQDDPITQVSFSPDGEMVACVGENGSVSLWDTKGREQKSLDAHDHLVWDVLFSPDGRYLATASYDQTVKLWTRAGELVQTFPQLSNVAGIAFSNDGQILAAAGWDGTINFWSPDGEKINTISDPASIMTCIAFSPNGKWVAAGNTSHKIKLWSYTDLSAAPRVLTGHSSAINNLHFSPDGQLLVSGSEDRTVRRWDVKTGELLTTYNGHNSGVTDLSIHPNGSLIASASSDHVKLWSVNQLVSSADTTLDADALLDRSCEWLYDYLQHNPHIGRDERQLCTSSGRYNVELGAETP